ncbi:MAG: XRE family transcriptional regulator [Anaerolineaceae bacterium]|nr:XRE family transcriptional regulator [Anaerolineaceae bacterium]
MNRNLPDPEIMYRAFEEKDSHFDGIFYTGVKTTGIFCRPTCPAKKPKRENVLFFASAKDALDYGFRPCKRCRPMENPGKQPDWIVSLLEEIHNNPQTPLKDADLQKRGLEPNRVRRWFKQNHGITFQGYLRALRINHAFGHLQKGDAVTPTAFDSGYQSLSGFQDSYKKHIGKAPTHSLAETVIQITRLETPLGPMLAGSTQKEICLLEFSDRRMLETQLKRLKFHLKAETLPGKNPLLNELEKQLNAYFSGQLQQFDLPLMVPGTVFQKDVWDQLRKIPYGETRSYKDLAFMIKRLKAVRAVGRANGDNRLAILIPCHRIVGENGQLTGYGGGLWRKKYLLDLEQSNKKT